MQLELTGKTALVTGAGRGIGLATVQALEREGCEVIAVTRTPTPELEASASRQIIADLTTQEGHARLSSALAGQGVELLVNNAGGGNPRESIGPFAQLSDAHWQHMFEVNLLTAARVTRLLLDGIIERRGVIVNVSSIGAWQPAGPTLAYNCAKAALQALGKGLADELAPHGVRVVTVSPGPVRTAVWTGSEGLGAQLAHGAGVTHEQFTENVPRMLGVPLGRFAEAEEVADLIAYLLSPRAKGITGADYRLDGGLVRVP